VFLQLVFYIPLYFEQRMNESLVQRIDTRFRVCKDSRDLVKKFLSALATWADRKVGLERFPHGMPS
jgi:hypothetical protein